MQFALNQMSAPNLGIEAFLALAQGLGCAGVELRNDLGRPFFDGKSPDNMRDLLAAHELSLCGLSEVYAFNAWSDDRRAAVQDLAELAQEVGGTGIILIPRNDGQEAGNGERQANLRIALKGIAPIVEEAGIVGFIEPLGFPSATLRFKEEAAEAIAALGFETHFRLVHDTFHHAVSGEEDVFAELTGIVHVSGVTDTAVRLGEMRDADRVLVDPLDRLGNIAQLKLLHQSGWDGFVSMEAFAPAVHALADPTAALRRSFDFISSHLEAQAA